jgi:hypothetical protein
VIPAEIIELIKGCCERLPNGHFRFTAAGKIRFREIMAEHGIHCEIDDSGEVKEVEITRHDLRSDH